MDYSDSQWLSGEITRLPESPYSSSNSSDINDNTSISVSSVFHADAELDMGRTSPDVLLLSSDNVFFYVQSSTLLLSSHNGFAGLLYSDHSSNHSEAKVIHLQDDAAIFSILLLCLYGISCSQFKPTIETLVAAVDLLPVYGYEPKHLITSATSLHAVLLSHAASSPLEIYALAAHFDMQDLAVPTSSHLLSYPLSDLTDEVCERIGARYLKRLFFLHIGRSEALKRVLLSPPMPHPETLHCKFSEQKKITRAWSLASAYLTWEARSDISTSTMDSALGALGEHLTCGDCKKALQDRIKLLVVQWSIVKRTI